MGVARRLGSPLGERGETLVCVETTGGKEVGWEGWRMEVSHLGVGEKPQDLVLV